MFPAALSEGTFSLIPGEERQTWTLTFRWDIATRQILEKCDWSLRRIIVQNSYTYDTFYDSPYAKVLGDICSSLAGREITDSHEWVEQLMLFYNRKVAAILKKAGKGVLRRHAGKTERYQRFLELGLPVEKLAMSAGEYCLPTDSNTVHCGLGAEAYCHASSPIRRWADCINQMALRSVLLGGDVPVTNIEALNIMSKRAKRFERDTMFVRALLNPGAIEAIVVAANKLWVPVWNRLVTSKQLGTPGDRVIMRFHVDPGQKNWKKRIVVGFDPK
jgi:exoribonuclease R